MTLYRSMRGLRAEFFERRMEWLMLWPLIVYSIVLYVRPGLFGEAPHYAYLRQAMTAGQWEAVIVFLAVVRLMSLVARMIWGWPYYSVLALPAALMGFALWLQFTLSFLVSAVLFGTVLGPIAAHSTLVIAELINVATSSRDVGALLKERLNARRV